VPLALVAGVFAFIVCAWTARATDTTPAIQKQAVSDRDAASKPGRPQAVVEQVDVRAFDETEIRDFFIVENAVEIVETEGNGRDLRREPLIPASLTSAKLRGGVVLKQGETLAVGDVILRAILQNQSDRAITLRNADTGEFFDILPGETVIIAAGTSCSIACKSNAYACCNITQGTADCQCPPNAEVRACQVGGPTASACSISAEAQ